AFQWVNPKGWLVGAAAIAAFLDRRSGGALAQAAIFATGFMLVALPACLPWLAFGAALQRFFRAPRTWRIPNTAMAALLAASALLLVWTRFCPRAGLLARQRVTGPLRRCPAWLRSPITQFCARLRLADGR